MGFKDFAGSTIVHSTGGWAALAGAIVVGARRGKFRADGSVKATPPSNIPIVTLGVFILWFGWFGFNGGSQLALGGATDAVAISHILVNTNLAGGAGFLVALVIERPLLGRVDLMAGLNGALAGLVAITAGPDFASHYWAVIIGAVGGGICVAGLRLLEILKVDDVVGAIPCTCSRASGGHSPPASWPGETSAFSSWEWWPSACTCSRSRGWCGWC